MRWGILSDIHANYEALEAVLAVLSKERIDRYLCLGDIVGYGAEVHMGASSSDTTPKSVEKPAVDMPGELKKVKQDSINEIEKLRGAGGAGIDRTLILIIAAAVIGVAIICLLFLKRSK